MRKPPPSLSEFLEALDTVSRAVISWQQLLGAVQKPTREISDPSTRSASLRSGRKAGKPAGRWRSAIRAALKASDVPIRVVDLAQKIADVQGVALSGIRGIIGRTLYEMKRAGEVKHDKAAGTYWMRRTPAQPTRPVTVERAHADS